MIEIKIENKYVSLLLMSLNVSIYSKIYPKKVNRESISSVK